MLRFNVQVMVLYRDYLPIITSDSKTYTSFRLVFARNNYVIPRCPFQNQCRRSRDLFGSFLFLTGAWGCRAHDGQGPIVHLISSLGEIESLSDIVCRFSDGREDRMTFVDTTSTNIAGTPRGRCVTEA